MSSHVPSVKQKLSKHTLFLGVRLWILILALLLLLLILLLITILYLYMIFRRQRKSYNAHFHLSENPISLKNRCNIRSSSSLDRRLLCTPEIEMNLSKPDLHLMFSDGFCDKNSGVMAQASVVTAPELTSRTVVLDRWGGKKFTLKEIEMVTNCFAQENIIGSGDNGVVYRAVLLDNTRAAVKKLMSNSVIQSEDLINKVELIGQIRHKNLVRLLGYCVEGYNKILVNEYIDNGNLHQWLHGRAGEDRPLTWDKRMKIIRGIAKGLAYLHEDLEPKIIHQSIKSSNILLDHQWNPKISDVGLDKLHGSEWSISTSIDMGNSGYLAPESSCSGILNEKSDVYSFGILIMEIVSGKLAVDHNLPQVYLIDWLKSMVLKQKIAYVADPKLTQMPSAKELKRVVLIALRCVDPEVKQRPKMGHVIHMLEPEDLLLNDEHKIKNTASYHSNPQENHTVVRFSSDAFDSQDGEDSRVSCHMENRAHEPLNYENPSCKKY